MLYIRKLGFYSMQAVLLSNLPLYSTYSVTIYHAVIITLLLSDILLSQRSYSMMFVTKRTSLRLDT